jgi:hypothetical protein
MSHDPIFFTPNQSARFGQSRTLYKGGGGGDGGAADREAARQNRIDAGTKSVNSIFGIGNDEAQKQRTAMYDTTKNDTRQFFTGQLEEDRAKAIRDMEFQKARMGIIGSSQANDLDSEFQKRYDRGLLDVANRADNAATSFRTADEQARLGLIAKVVAGLDQGSAAQNAMSTLQTNQNAAKEAYQSQRMGNVFSDLLGAYNQQQYNQGMQQGKQQGTNQYGNWFSNDQPVSGEIT